MNETETLYMKKKQRNIEKSPNKVCSASNRRRKFRKNITITEIIITLEENFNKYT